MKTYRLYKVNIDIEMLHLVAGNVIRYDRDEDTAIVEKTGEILPSFIKVDDRKHFTKIEDEWIPTFGKGAKVHVKRNGYEIGDGIVTRENSFQLDIELLNGDYVYIDKTWYRSYNKYDITKVSEYYFLSSTGAVCSAKVGKNKQEDEKRFAHYNVFSSKQQAMKIRARYLTAMKKLKPDSDITKVAEYYFVSSTGDIHTVKVGKDKQADKERLAYYNMFSSREEAVKVRAKFLATMKKLNPDNNGFKF